MMAFVIVVMVQMNGSHGTANSLNVKTLVRRRDNASLLVIQHCIGNFMKKVQLKGNNIVKVFPLWDTSFHPNFKSDLKEERLKEECGGKIV